MSPVPDQTRERFQSLGYHTSPPRGRLVIFGGNPDLLDPVLGQLSGHSSDGGEEERSVGPGMDERVMNA
jgi:hypothetical protein